MVFLSDDINSIISFSLVTIFAFWFSGKSAWRVIVLLAALVFLSDWSGALLKYWFAAERPCHALEGVRVLHPCVHYSFPSNHAINMAAAATYIGWHYRMLITPMAILALLVGVSRVYVGVHYPGDVLFGWIWGVMFAAAYCWICWRFIPGIYHKQNTVPEGKNL